MSDNNEHLCPAHFNGSVPLENVETVLRSISSALGKRTLRLPDGEVGSKEGWITNQLKLFARHPAFEAYEAEADWRTPGQRRRRFRLKAGVSLPRAADFGPLGYAEWAIRDYAAFSRLKREGAILRSARLKIALPTPYDSLNYALDHGIISEVAPIYEECLIQEIAQIMKVVPADEVAVQWDAAHEFEALATNDSVFFPLKREEIVALLVRLGDAIPGNVELGYHCCYGNYNLKHFVEPDDTGDMVEIMNSVMQRLIRPVNFIHMPVPRERSDDAYFAPLEKLELHPQMQVFLGLIHDQDGTPGALARVQAAHRYLNDFGIAMECGLSQRTPESVRELFRIHNEVAGEIDKLRETS
jgi:hypothetical protein